MPPAYPSASTLKPLGAPLVSDPAAAAPSLPAFPFASFWRKLRAFSFRATPAASALLRTNLEVADRASTPSRSATPPVVARYFATLQHAWDDHDWTNVSLLFETLLRAWREGRQVFLCGNGGSAANAIHLANDLLYGVDKQSGRGLRVTALPANASVLTCLANDVSYADVFAQQLTVLAQPGDVLIALSGSGSSPNIVQALVRARELRLTSFAILGFSGGRSLTLADHAIHFPVDDMQVAEDLQMMVGHMAMQWLSRQSRTLPPPHLAS